MFGSSSKRLALAFLLFLASVTVSYGQSQLEGDWQGVLKSGGGVLHLAWHVRVAPDGAVSSTFDNVDDQVLGIRAKSIELKGTALTLTVDDTVKQGDEPTHVAGTLMGRLSADGTALNGTWEQSAPEVETDQIELTRATATRPDVQAPGRPAAQPGIAGDWTGKLSAGGAELTLVLHIVAGKDGALSATLDSVDQGANGIPVTSITLSGSHLSLRVDSIRGTYEGTVNQDVSGIEGTWSQGMPLPLNFKRGVPAKPAPKPAPPADAD